MDNSRLLPLSGVLVLFFFMTARLLYSQEIAVKNVQFEDMGETVHITYNLEGNPKHKYRVSVALSHDGGTTFKDPLRYVEGDAGRNMRPGSEKTIVWELAKEYPFGLVGDHFVFAVTAVSQKSRLLKLPYLLAGTGLVGGIIYLFATKVSEESVITIYIPAEYE